MMTVRGFTEKLIIMTELKEYLTRALEFPQEIHLESHSGCNANCTICLDGGSNILMADFTWKKLASIKKGDYVIGFKKGIKFKEKTKIIKTKVLATMSRRADRIKLHTTKGHVICTETHSFCDRYHKSKYKEARLFKPTQHIKFVSKPNKYHQENDNYVVGYLVGMIQGDGCFYREKRTDMLDKNPLRFQLAVKDNEIIERFAKYLKLKDINYNKGKHAHRKSERKHLWKEMARIRVVSKQDVEKLNKISKRERYNDEYKKGFLAGFFDAEGSLYKRGLHFTNTDLELINKICENLNYFNFNYTVTKRRHTKFKDCYDIRMIGGLPESIRFLTLTNPVVKRKKEFMLNQAIENNAIVIKIEKLNKGMVYNITTESGNYIANGFYSKNCPRDGMTRYRGDMDRQLFIKAVDECSGRNMSYIHFHLNGEPLLMDIDELCYRIDYTRMANPIIDHERMTPKLCFFTNGSLLDEAKAGQILNSQLDIIVISIDGGNKRDYENIRKGLTWETVVENVRFLVNLRNETLSKLWIQTAIIPQMANKGSLDRYFALFKSMGVDDVGGSGVQNIGGLIDSESMIIKGNQYDKGNVNAPCWRVFLDLSVMADGRCVVCCQDVRGMEVIGDLNTQSIMDVWHGDRMAEIRDNFVHGRKREIPFCKNCDYMRSMVAPDWWNVSMLEFVNTYEEVVEGIIQCK